MIAAFLRLSVIPIFFLYLSCPVVYRYLVQHIYTYIYTIPILLFSIYYKLYIIDESGFVNDNRINSYDNLNKDLFVLSQIII